MDQNAKIVSLSFLVGGLLIWFVMGSFFAEMMSISGIRDPLWNTFMPVSRIVALAVAVGVTIYGLKSQKTFGYGLDVVAELRKVTWPSIEEVRAATIVTIVLVIIITILLGLFDFVWGGLTSLIYSV